MIDRVIGNVTWKQQNIETTLHIRDPSVSNHALLYL